jgi:hypothetical protein
MYLQTKNENLEQENKMLRKENDELLVKSKRTHKNSDERNMRNRTTLTQTKSQNNFRTKNDHMEVLLKEQIHCMKKMLLLVQDDKPPKKIKDNNNSDYSDSNLHFEESFNVTNMSSNSGNDFAPETVYIF